MQLVQYPKEIE